MEDQRKCSMCRNHFGSKAPSVRDHKCEFKNPSHIEKCRNGCKKVDDRRKKVAEDKRHIYKIEKLQNCVAKRISPSNRMTSSVERTCRKCKIHNQTSLLRGGHLKNCPLMNCPCKICQMIDERRKASNNFTKHYREQRIDEQKCSQPPNLQSSPESGYTSEHDNYSPESTESSMSNECLSLPEYFSSFKNTFDETNQTSYAELRSKEATNINSNITEQLVFDSDDAFQIIQDILSNFPLETVENLEKNVFEPTAKLNQLESFECYPDVCIADDIMFDDL